MNNESIYVVLFLIVVCGGGLIIHSFFGPIILLHVVVGLLVIPHIVVDFLC